MFQNEKWKESSNIRSNHVSDPIRDLDLMTRLVWQMGVLNIFLPPASDFSSFLLFLKHCGRIWKIAKYVLTVILLRIL